MPTRNKNQRLFFARPNANLELYLFQFNTFLAILNKFPAKLIIFLRGRRGFYPFTKKSPFMNQKKLHRIKAMCALWLTVSMTIAAIAAKAQTLSGIGCTGNVLTVTSSSMPVQIKWQRDGAVIGTNDRNFAPDALTIAGTGTSGSGATQVSYPYGIAVDGSGNVYIADHENFRVQKWAPGATAGTTVAGTGVYGSSASQLTKPEGLFVDATGNIYIGDAFNHRVQKWAPGATSGVTVAGVTGISGTAANLLSHPYGVFADATGNTYVCDQNNHRVQKWAPGATSGITVAGGNGGGGGANQLNYPAGLFVDESGNIYVADLNNARIQKWAPGATSGTTLAGTGTPGSSDNELNGPADVYIDAAGNLIIADEYNNRIQRWAPGATSGTTIASVGGYGTGPSQTAHPTGIAFDNSGNLYTTDYYNNRIQKYTPSITTTCNASVAGDYDAVLTTLTGNLTTNVITVYPIPNPGVINGRGFVCIGSEITLSDTSTTGSWSASNGNATVTGGLVHGVASGTVIISYTDATPTCGTATTTRLIAVYDPPALYTASPCTGNALSVTGDNPPVQIKWQRDGSVVGINDRTYAPNALTIAGTGTSGSGASQVSYPYGIAVDGSGNVYIADHENFRVQMWTPGATAGTTVAGTGVYGSSANQLTKPEGLFVDAAGNIYIGDAFNQRVQKWAPGATSGVTVAGVTGISGTAANLLSHPYGVFADVTGNTYVCDQNNHRVQKWAPGATSGTTVAGGNGGGGGANQLNNPAGLFVDEDGNVYVADLGNARVQKWAPGATSGTTVAGTGTPGSGDNELNGPADVYIDAAGNLIIADEYNNRIQKWTPGATSGTTFASVGGYGTGPSQTAHPTALAFDNSGNLYTTDYYNNRIQKYMASITTTYNPSVAGDYSAVVAVFTGNLTTNIITVNASPNPGRILGHPAVFVGSDMTLTDAATTGTWSTSNSNATVSGGVVHGVTAGTVLVSYTDVSVYCGSASATKTMTVYNVPTLDIPTPCIGNILSLTSDLQPTQINWLRDGVTTGTDELTYADNAITVAGTGYSGSDASQVSYAYGIAVDGSGNVYIADHENFRVQKWAPGATAGTTVAGTGVYGSSASQLTKPEGLFVDATGNIYVGDAFNHRVQKWAPGATSGVTVAGVTGVSGTAANLLSHPYGVFADATGNIYICDQNNHRVQKWLPEATSGITVAGGNGAGGGANQLSYPAGLFVDDNGNIYIADLNNARVQKWAPGATSGTTVAGTGASGSGNNELSGPSDVYIDVMGNLYIADQYNNRIQKWAPGATSGITAGGVGGYGTGPSQLEHPAAIAFDNTGAMYTTDYYNNRIQKFTASIVTTYNVTAPGNYTAVINSVAGSVTTDVLTVLPTPSAGPITGTAVVCAGGATTALTDAAGSGAWNSTASGIATVGSTGIVTGVSGGTATISYTVSNVCGSSTATTTVTVNPLADPGTISGSSTVAVGGNTSLSDAVSGGTWSASNSHVTVSAGIVHGVSAGTSIISYSVSNGCGISSATKLITVGVVTSVSPISGYYFYMCSGATASFFDATPGGSWSIAAAEASVASVSASGVVTGLSAGTATLSYTVGINVVTAVTTVHPTPAAISGSAQVCLGTTTALTDITPGGAWSSGVPSTASIGSNGIVSGTNPGTTPIYYTLVAPAGCKVSLMVTVSPAPAAITGPASVCNGASISLSDATPGGTWSSRSSTVSVNGTGGVTGVSTGAATITYTAPTGCYRTYPITVNGINAGSISGASTVVAGATISLSDAAAGGTWSASNANATVSATGIVTGVSAGTVTISYTVTNACGSLSATYVVTVSASSTPGITGNLSICNGLTSALTNTAGGGAWHSSNTLIATVGTSGLVAASATNTGTVTISYTVGAVVTTAIVTVNPNPSNIGGANSVCLGAMITLSNFTAGGTWSSTAGVSVTNGTTVTTVTGLSVSANTVTYTLATGCYKSFGVTVKALPAAISGNLSVCGVGAVSFLSDATAGTSWAISPVSTATVSASGRVYGVSAGTANVTFTATNTCIATAIVTVNTLVTLPAISGVNNVSNGATITLSDATPGGAWSSSNPALGSVNGVGAVTGVGTAGVVTITYALAYGSGCTAIATKAVTVHTPAPHTHGATATTTAGTALVLPAEITGGEWTGSDNTIATVDENGVVNAIAAGTVTITHTSTNNSGEIFVSTTQVLVNELPMEASLLPNPNKGTFTVKGVLGTKDAEITIEITNMLGQVVYSSKTVARGGIINAPIVLNNALANGMYVLNLRSGNESKTFHFVTEK